MVWITAGEAKGIRLLASFTLTVLHRMEDFHWRMEIGAVMLAVAFGLSNLVVLYLKLIRPPVPYLLVKC